MQEDEHHDDDDAVLCYFDESVSDFIYKCIVQILSEWRKDKVSQAKARKESYPNALCRMPESLFLVLEKLPCR